MQFNPMNLKQELINVNTLLKQNNATRKRQFNLDYQDGHLDLILYRKILNTLKTTSNIQWKVNWDNIQIKYLNSSNKPGEITINLK